MVDFIRLFKFLCDFWKKQRARLRMQKKVVPLHNQLGTDLKW